MQVFWLEQPAAEVPEDDLWLAAAERSRLSGLRVPKRRSEWRLGRWTAKRALAGTLGPLALAAIEIRAAPSGAPEAFVDGRRAPLAISLSHREGLALCAVAPEGAALGCDLEVVEPRSFAFVADYFTTEEQALTARAADRWQTVALLWSAKESALKAIRAGLRLDTRRVSAAARCAPWGAVWHPLEVRIGVARVFQGWWRREGDLIRTVVADPPPSSPTAIAVRSAYGIVRMLA